eukprot:555432-Amphidinium_carterae.1
MVQQEPVVCGALLAREGSLQQQQGSYQVQSNLLALRCPLEAPMTAQPEGCQPPNDHRSVPKQL